MTARTRNTDQELPSGGTARLGASPAAAAAFAAGIAYVWAEAAHRLLFTYNPDFNARWQLWNGRPGDVAAMWLTITVVGAAVGVGLYRLWARKDRVGYVTDWTILLIGSGIAAPMIGEIGQSAGSPSDGAGSSAAVTIIAYSLLVFVVLMTAALLTRLHTRR